MALFSYKSLSPVYINEHAGLYIYTDKTYAQPCMYIAYVLIILSCFLKGSRWPTRNVASTSVVRADCRRSTWASFASPP